MANILVVDNNRCIVDLLEEILVNGGHQVSTAQSGMQASQIFKKRAFDLALIDLGLPDIDGLTLIRDLKSNNNPTIPIVISGRSDIGAAVEAFRAGARDYILKPFDIDQILRLAMEIPKEKNNTAKIATGTNRSSAGFWNQLVNVLLDKFLDSLLVALSFFACMIIQNAVLPYQSPLTSIFIRKIIYLSACLGFCWGFVAEYFYRSDKPTYTEQLKNYSYRLGIAYLLFGTILFIVFPLADCRPAMFGSYLLGLAAMTISRQYVFPLLSAALNANKEGKRRIVIVGNGSRAENMLNNLLNQFGPSQVEKVKPTDQSEYGLDPDNKRTNTRSELHLEAGSLNHEEINQLIKNFGGNRIVINVPENSPEEEKKLVRV